MLKKIIVSLVVLSISVSLSAQEKLTLEHAIAIGLKNNYGLTISKLETDIADRNSGWAAAGAYPTITANLSVEHLENGTMNNSAGASVDAVWTLFNGFRIKVTKRINDYKYDLAKGSEVIQIENCISDIVLYYNSYMLEQELLEVNKTLYKLSEDRYQKDKLTAKTGGKGTYELIQSESAYLSDYQSYLLQEKSVKMALNALNLAMGADVNQIWTIPTVLTIPEKDYDVLNLRSLMINNNATLKNQYIYQKMNEENISMAKGDALPRVDLKAGGRWNYMFQDNRSFLNEGSNSLQLYAGASASVAIFSNGIKRRNIAIAGIQAKIGATTIEQMQRELTTKLIDEVDNYEYSKQLFALASREKEVSKINLDLSLERLNNGTISSFDYRSVQVAYLNAAYRTLQATYSLIRANVELTRLTGGVVQPE